jgi:ABC-type multidrug transport system fused ATPase/permease subunit
MKGIITFRALGWVPHGIEQNNRLVDASQRPAYLLAMIQRWLALVLQLVVAGLSLTVVCFATQLRLGSAFTGASLVTLMNFGESLSMVVRMYTMLETSIGAVARLKAFSDTAKSESRDGEDFVPPAQWPSRGVIVVDGVSASYT